MRQLARVWRLEPLALPPVTFEPLPDHELQKLADEQLIAYIRDARDAGRARARPPRAGDPGLRLRARRQAAPLDARSPTHVVDDLAHDALVRAIAAAFDGSSVGEFRSWLHTIVDRTAVDFFRRAERRPKESILPSEHAGEDDVWGAEPSVESEAGAVELRIIVEEVLETFNEKHRLVIELHVFGGLTAGEVCDRIEGMSEDNVAQIASRFRAKLRARLDPESEMTDERRRPPARRLHRRAPRRRRGRPARVPVARVPGAADASSPP